MSIPYLKSSWDEIYELELDNFLKTGANKFRTKLDINHWLIRYYRLAKGEFIPKKFSCCKYFDVSDNNNELRQAIINPKIKEICINDSNSDVDYEKVRKEVIDAFEEILPEKSSFEK